MDALNVLRFFGISLIPFAVALVIHLIFKFTNPLTVRKPEYLVPIKRKFLYKYIKYPLQKFGYIIFTTKKGAYWWRMSVLGVIFGILSIVGYYLGVEVPVRSEVIQKLIGTNFFVVGNSTVPPVIAGLVFGWPAGVISAGLGSIFRACMGGWLGWPTAVAILLSGLVTGAVSHFIFKDKRPVWYFGIFIAAFVETTNILLIYLFNTFTVNITEVYTLVSLFDVMCIGFAALSVGGTTIVISLIEKEHIFARKKEFNNISFHVEVALVIACAIGMATMTLSVRSASSLKSRQDYTQIAKETNGDIRVEFDDAAIVTKDPVDDPKGLFYVSNTLYSVPERHHVGTGGYVIAVAGIGGNIPKHLDSDNCYRQHDIISVRNNSAYRAIEGTEFYIKVNGKRKHLEDYAPGKLYTVMLDDEMPTKCLMIFNHINFTYKGSNEAFAQAYIAVIVPFSEIESASGTVFRISLYTNLMVVIALFTFAEYFVNQKIVRKVEMMDRSLEEIMDGNLDKELHIEGYNEFTNLSNNINLTVGALKNYAQEVELRIDNELQFARDIQTSSVPTQFPFEKSYNIFARMEPAKEVGGDFYDYFKMNNGKIMFLIADVSGKGIPAAMFMMRAKTLIKSLSSTDLPLEDIVNTANKDLCAQNEAALFVTAWIGILDSNNGELRYINAGHMNPLLKKKDGKFAEFPNKHNFVLAAMPDYKYKAEIAYLEPGDEIVLFTDGVTEAHNINKELYGTERLIEFANKAQYFNAKQLLDEISDDVVKYADGVEQFDDMTLLILRYLGTKDIIPETAITLKARPTNAVLAVNFVESVLAKYELPPTFIARVSIVIDELFANIAFYAYPQDYVGEATIQVDFRNEAFYLTLIDSGIQFDPTAPREVDTSSSIEDRKRGGLGIFIVKKTMDELKYEYKDNKNTLNLVKYLKNIPPEKKKQLEEVEKEDEQAKEAAAASSSEAPASEAAPATEAPKEPEKELITDPAALEAALASLPDDEPAPAPKAEEKKPDDNSGNNSNPA